VYPGLTANAKLEAGTALLLPGTAEPEVPATMTLYLALNNETIKAIGQKLGIDPADLMEVNKNRIPGLTVTAKLKTGTEIVVPIDDELVQEQYQVYLAQEDETPKLIAEKLGVTARELVEFNTEKFPSLVQSSKLKQGTMLYIPGTLELVTEVSEPKATTKRLVTIGNEHEVLETVSEDLPGHRWTAFVRHANGAAIPNSAMGITSVVFQLHPDFEPSTVTMDKPPFEVTRDGWGTFPVGVQIHLSDGTVKKHKHELLFEETTSFTAVALD